MAANQPDPERVRARLQDVYSHMQRAATGLELVAWEWGSDAEVPLPCLLRECQRNVGAAVANLREYLAHKHGAETHRLVVEVHFKQKDGQCIYYRQEMEHSRRVGEAVDQLLNRDGDGDDLPDDQRPLGEVCAVHCG